MLMLPSDQGECNARRSCNNLCLQSALELLFLVLENYPGVKMVGVRWGAVTAAVGSVAERSGMGMVAVENQGAVVVVRKVPEETAALTAAPVVAVRVAVEVVVA